MKKIERKTTGSPTAKAVAPAAFKKDVPGPSGLISNRPIKRSLAFNASHRKRAPRSHQHASRTIKASGGRHARRHRV